MKRISTIVLCASAVTAASAQGVTQAYQISQQELRGTARFMSMAGAFGALGGDLSCLAQNPGGIGIYRNSDIGFTLGLDIHDTQSENSGQTVNRKFTKFNLNNIGGVFTLRTPSSALPNLNFGFTYQRSADFARRYNGGISRLPVSLSNYIAGIANANHYTEADMNFDNGADWLTVLAYNALLINPEGPKEDPHWYGQFGQGTTDSGNFDVEERGGIDEYNIAIGGNIENIVYWGLDCGITDLHYKLSTVWGESLNDAYVYNPNMKDVQTVDCDWKLHNRFGVRGTGVNFKMGVIVKPVQELRFGVAFHTPTYYNMTQTLDNEVISFDYPFPTGGYDYAEAGNEYDGPYSENISFRTPFKFIGSVAGVIANRFILSADYEWCGYKTMRYSDYHWDDYDYGWGWDDPYYPWYPAPMTGAPRASSSWFDPSPKDLANSSIKEIYKNTNTFRVGAEWKALPSLSIRAGYSFTSSPVNEKARNNQVDIPSSGSLTSYRLDDVTQYVTAGAGYRKKGFYLDIAYIYKRMDSEYHPFSPDPEFPLASASESKLKFNTSQVVMTMGFKF